MLDWLCQPLVWVNQHWAQYHVFLENASANALGTVCGGLFLTLLYFVFGHYIFRPPQLGGSWAFDATIEHTKYNPFRGMLVRYKILLIQNGLTLTGTAEKTYENSREACSEHRCALLQEFFHGTPGRLVAPAAEEQIFNERPGSEHHHRENKKPEKPHAPHHSAAHHSVHHALHRSLLWL